MNCKNCGSPLSPEDVFCTVCGTKVDSNGAQEQAVWENTETTPSNFENTAIGGTKIFEGQQQFGGDNGFGQQQFGGDNGFGQQQFGGDSGFGQQQFGGDSGFGQQQFGGDNGFGQQQFGGDNGFGQQFGGDNGLGQQPTQTGDVSNNNKGGSGNKKTIIIIIIAVVVAAALAVGTAFLIKYIKEQQEDTSITETVEEDTTSGEIETTTQADSGTVEPEEEPTTEDTAILDKARGYNADAEMYGGHAYAIFNYKDEGLLDYDECESFCEDMGGHLAVINSQEENDFIYGYVKKQGLTLAMFGYTDSGSEGNWRWVNGSKSGYTNWAKGQPNNGAKNDSKAVENYAEFSKETKDGKWNDTIFGSNTYRFVCEWE